MYKKQYNIWKHTCFILIHISFKKLVDKQIKKIKASYKKIINSRDILLKIEREEEIITKISEIIISIILIISVAYL